MYRWEMEEGQHKLLLRKLDEKRARGRPKIRWENNIIWDLEEVEYECDWKAFAQDKVTWHAYVLAALNLRVP